MFAQDRDLLVLEPNLFRDVGWLAQRLVKGTGDIAGGTLALVAQDVTFEAAGVEGGHVVLVGPAGEATAYEILERLSATEIAISRPRENLAAPAIAPAPTSNAAVEIWTLRPQIALAHDQAMRMIGIEPGDLDAAPSEADITNISAVRMVEALGALHLIYAAAAGPDGSSASRTFAKAEWYRQRYAAARQHTPVHLDLNGDGQPDATRRFNILQFIR